ncbi:MAG: hypothetical protein KA004_01260 [Verrucomicrobiales bacterium]|nr:hypothetical protein [Verrucomicrobiales bacterium]
MKFSLLQAAALSGCLAVFSPVAQAVVIAGPNGAAAGNITQASLNTYVSGNALPAFPYWNNVVAVDGASGVYLGASGNYGWVLTAAHVGQLAVGSGVITVNGTNFTVRANVPVGTQDLRLYRIGGETGDPALPGIPNVVLATGSPVVTTGLLAFGRGARVETTANDANNSDAGQLPGTDSTYFEWTGAGAIRWGSNQTALLPSWAGPAVPLITIGTTVNFLSVFDDPGTGNYLTTTELNGASGDSGGPAFTINSGAWQLSGVMTNVGSDPGTGQPAGTTGFGNITTYADLATYQAVIQGLMIPEPSAAALALLGLLGTLRRRR